MSSLPPDPHRTPRDSTAPGRRWLARTAEGCVVVLYLVAASTSTFGFFDELPSEVKAALGCAAVALVLLRRRLPLMALLGLAAIAGALPTVGLLTAVAAFTVARRIEAPRHRGGMLLTSAGLPVVISVYGTTAAGYGSWLVGFTLGVVVAGVGVLIPGLVGSSVGQQDRLVVALRHSAAAAEEARRLADNASRVEERARIAAEMHDLVGHRLSLISLHSGGLEMALAAKAPELKDDATQVRLATRDAMQELREVLGVLGPLGRDTGTGVLTDATGTRADIEALAEESRAVGIPVNFAWDGPDLADLEPRVRRAVHRVVRESLTNVHRYATGATVELTVTRAGGRVGVRVRNGAPPAPPEATTGLGTGRGLTGLRERARLLGGELRAEPTAVGGFLVDVSLPSHPDTAVPEDGTDAAAPRADDLVAGASRSGALRHLPGAAAALLGIAGVGAMLFFGISLVESSRPVAESVPDRTVRTGMTREEVRSVVGWGSDVVSAAAAGREPPRPPGTDCLFPYETHRKPKGLEVTRYCFRGDVLVNSATFTVPMAPAGP
ncbi:sensor histidine kinase [Streptomyces sp. NPDC017993]|uniref:sensor histidine kinase n=1 Tax=Streptomyces sp. NPDC017993 TaxID=3365027 RepID=UPI003790514E